MRCRTQTALFIHLDTVPSTPLIIRINDFLLIIMTLPSLPPQVACWGRRETQLSRPSLKIPFRRMKM